MANEKKKYKDPDIAAISAQNLSGKGWHFNDFNAASAMNPNTNPLTQSFAVSQPGAEVASPAEKEKIKQVLTNPDEAIAADGPINATKRFIGQLFDYTDEQDNPVEWAWDGLWRSMGWVYDRVNQGASWAVSAAPGGIDTFTWDQAGEISFGQAAMATGAANVNKYGFIPGQLLNLLSAPSGLGTGFGGMAAYQHSAGPLGEANFDVTNPEMRKAAFEDSTVGRWASGITDAVFSNVADPFLFVGKFAGLAKLRYLDDTFQGVQGLNRLRTQFIESAAKPFEQKAPIAQFAELTARTTDDGGKLLTERQIAERLKGATGQEVIASALYHNTDPRNAELIMRYAFNDIEAGKELLAARPALAMAMMRKQRERIGKILERDPSRKTTMAGVAERAAQKLDDQLRSVRVGSDEYNRLKVARDMAQETYNAVMDNTLGQLDNVAGMTPEVEALMVREFKDLVRHDESLAKFIDDEAMRVGSSNASSYSQAFAGSTKGFARNTAVGRFVEGSRMRRAEAAVEAASTRGAMIATGKMVTLADGTKVEQMRRVRPWESTEFGGTPFQKAVRVWRWFGEENPSGFIVTKGAGALNSWREVKAVLDDVNIYSGDARTVRITQQVEKDGKMIDQVTEFQVGGRQRKEELLRLYMDAVHDSTAGAEAAQVALSRVEDMIFNDISAWHGMTKETAETIKDKAMRQRESVINGLRRQKDEAFWIDENGQKNKAPWLEAHIQNGTYMLNYRAYNRLARLHDESGALKHFDTTQQFVGKNAKYAYDLFNEMWRPAVLLRLGYTQRNVAEGMFRSLAYTFSLDPLRNAVQTGAFGVRNAYVKYNLRKAQDKAEVAARLRASGKSNIKMPKAYESWLVNQIDANDTEILRNEEWINQTVKLVADTTPEAKQFVMQFQTDRLGRLMEKRSAATAAGASRSELSEIDDMIKAAQDDLIETSNITKFVGESEDSVRALMSAQGHMPILQDRLARRAALNDDMSAALLFRQQGAAKRRVYDGVIEAPDGTVLYQAFNPNSGYSGIALSNLSADGTTRSLSTSTAEMMESGLKAYRMKYYVDVKPDQPGYYEGVANALRQLKYSEIGQMAIEGRSVEDISTFLLKDPKGREILEFIVHGENRLARKKGGDLLRINKEAADQVAGNVVSRYAQLAPDESLQAFMRGTYIDENFSGDLVKKFLTDADGKAKYDLQPVVGHIAEEVGAASVRQKINEFTSAGMRWLGTIPEDAFVRAPFYGQRYETVLRGMVDNLQAQLPADAKITTQEYSNMMRAAHRRALKDTKEWMFTIERRTNLGMYGEMFVPFISATQNSITTVGRLIWKDPAVGVLLAKLYQAPEKMDLVDEQGNIAIPIPHDLIPDSVENALGWQDMTHWKFSFSQLNLIAPQLEEGTLFRFGPTVAVPASIMMKNGFLISPDAPGPLKALVGDDAAATVWSAIQDYTFGSDQAPPDLTSALLPPQANRLLQLWQKTDNASYARTYNTFLHAETLKKRAGLRDNYPTKEELTNMTNNLTLVKWFANAFAAFPPQYESTLQPIVDEYRRIDNEVKSSGATGNSAVNETDRRFSELYGSTLLIAKDLGMSKGYVPAVEGMVTAANKYQDLIGRVSSDLGDTGDLSVLSMLFTDKAAGLFDGSTYSWQMNNNITGTLTKWRERLSPEEAMTADAKNAGWVRYLQFQEQLDARLAAFGLKSYDYAPGLQAEKDQFIAQMAGDPLYGAWFRDYKEYGSSRTNSTILMMQSALTDKTFMQDHVDSPVWSAASQYLEGRAKVIDALNQTGSSIDSQRNAGIKNWWDTFRSDLKTQIPDWGAFANRFLDGDDDPQNPGVTFGQVMVGD